MLRLRRIDGSATARYGLLNWAVGMPGELRPEPGGGVEVETLVEVERHPQTVTRRSRRSASARRRRSAAPSGGRRSATCRGGRSWSPHRRRGRHRATRNSRSTSRPIRSMPQPGEALRPRASLATVERARTLRTDAPRFRGSGTNSTSRHPERDRAPRHAQLRRDLGQRPRLCPQLPCPFLLRHLAAVPHPTITAEGWWSEGPRQSAAGRRGSRPMTTTTR